jgi:hypothetical protein
MAATCGAENRQLPMLDHSDFMDFMGDFDIFSPFLSHKNSANSQTSP